MKEKPIIFTTEMIKPILDNSKTRTRRIMKPQLPCHGFSRYETTDCDVVSKGGRYIRCPYGAKGTILWVRETWARYGNFQNPKMGYVYRAGDNKIPDESQFIILKQRLQNNEIKWCPSIHMPRRVARLFLKVEDIKIEQLQDITEEEAIAEGVERDRDGWKAYDVIQAGLYKSEAHTFNLAPYKSAIYSFQSLWDSLYSAPSPVKRKGKTTHYESYPWENIQETREHKGLPWIVKGNPWLWNIKFVRLEGYNG